MKKLNLVVLLVGLWAGGFTQSIFGDYPLAHTYSIIAHDPETGEMGAAVQSHWFSVGSLVIWGEAGVGVVATQSFVNPSYGPRGLALLKTGMSAQMAAESLVTMDSGRDYRQMAILDKNGGIAAYTGKKCIEAAGHLTGYNYSVQANLMTDDSVWPAMAKAFETAQGPLAERLIAALEAAQDAGGDIRGKQSAAILVVRGAATGNIWEDRLMDLRVEDHTDPVRELTRLVNLFRAYEHMNKGDIAMEEGDVEEALRHYSTAESKSSDNLEMKYWHAVSLVNSGKLEEALPVFKMVFEKDPIWRTLTPRLLKNGLLKIDEQELEKIMGQKSN